MLVEALAFILIGIVGVGSLSGALIALLYRLHHQVAVLHTHVLSLEDSSRARDRSPDSSRWKVKT
jgi:hypothetical protein